MRNLSQALALAIALGGALLATAQEAKPALELHTAGGQTTFHLGERIELSLTLTGPDNKQYSIDTASYDRSGRLDIDSFAVSPAAGWSDPLAQYFSQGAFGGGLRGSEPLSSKPVTFKADLNEHVRFDQAGTFTVTATSHRVGTVREGGFPGEPYLAIVSNPVEIHIVAATPEWQAGKLLSILAILAKPRKVNPGSPDQEDAAALADLRYLHSPAAIELLAADLREDGSGGHEGLLWAAALGLAGVPDGLRDDALHAMSRQLDDPAFPVCDFFLRIMAGLEASPHAESAELRATQDARFLTVWQLALGGLPRKQGAARASTAETLLSSAPHGRTQGLTAQIAAIVAGTLTALPIDRQVAELEYNWDELNRQPMLPVLQALLRQLPARGNNFYGADELYAVVFRRWYELDPAGASRELAARLANPAEAFTPRTVRFLPGGPLPQLESGWTRELLESKNGDREALFAALLVRFGTGTANAQVAGKLDAVVGKEACEPQAAMLGYVVKFGADEAGSLVQRAMAAREETRCFESLFSSVSAYAHGPVLGAAAVAGLHDPEPRAAADAANYLRYYGREADRKPLMDRYREWSERWAPQPEKVDPGKPSGYPTSLLGQSLGEALIANQAWLADPALIAEVLRLCVGEQMCGQLRTLVAEGASATPNVILSRTTGQAHYQAGQYSTDSLDLFEAKLAQYPRGTKFVLIPSSPRNGDQLRLEHEAEDLFTQHGLTLALPPQGSAALQ